ncbi:MAG: F0F1 ATP synthase subunit A [Bacillota bacterium]
MNPGPEVITYLFGNENLPVTDTLLVSWAVVILVIVFSRLATRDMSMIPDRLQNGLELFVEVIHDQIEPLLPGEGWRFFPLIATLFVYVGVGNLIGLVPGVPSATGDLNATLGLALVVFLVSHYEGMREYGPLGYLKGFGEPVIFLLPLNVVGELAKPVSHSFRLFGNVVGGTIIMALIYQAFPWLFPVVLHAWFDIFVGLVQTLIFGMVAIAYISVAKNT